jgi:hypothetical protein
MAQCKAKSKRTGERCKHGAVGGREVCKWHGGKTPIGVASPHFRTGRYSRHLPANLAGRLVEALNDPDLLGLQDDIALIDVRICDLLHTLDESAASDGKQWQEITDLIDRRGRTVERELKRLMLLQQFVPVEQVMAFVRAMGDIVARHVNDRSALANIVGEVESLVTREAMTDFRFLELESDCREVG